MLMDIYHVLFPTLIYYFLNNCSKAVKVDIINGRKDASTCCDKLPNSSFSTDCQTSYMWASGDEKYAYTPGFPNPFPIQKLCKWGIYTTPGKRIRLEFRDFYLIGPGDDGMCYSQGVIIKSPLSKLEMGPHCGNAGLPTVISAGNYLEVDLVSNIPMTTENYRGFKMAFVETVETPSPQLRPLNWGNDVQLTADPAVVNKIFPSPTVSSRGLNRRPVNSKTATKPPRFKPDRKLGALTPMRTPGGSSQRSGNSHYVGDPTIQPPRRYYPARTLSPETEASTALSLEEIVGIVVGGIVLLGITVLILISWKQKRKKKMKKKMGVPDNQVSDHPPAYTVESHNNGTNVPENGTSAPPPGYYVYYYQENEKKDETRHSSKVSKPSISKDPDFFEKTHKKQRKPDAKHKPGKKLRSTKHRRRLTSLKTMSITRPKRRTKARAKQKSKLTDNKMDAVGMKHDKPVLTNKKEHQRSSKDTLAHKRAEKKNPVNQANSGKTDSNEIKVYVIKKPRERKNKTKGANKGHELRDVKKYEQKNKPSKDQTDSNHSPRPTRREKKSKTVRK